MDFADLSRCGRRASAAGRGAGCVANIPVGIARNGHVDLGLAASPDLSSMRADAGQRFADGEGLQVHWLRPVPPIDNGQAQLRIVDPDTLDIIVTGGRQRLSGQKEGSPGGLQIRGGRMRITGLMQPHQIGRDRADIAGPLPDALALLREPRLALLDRHPIDLKNPAGQAAVKLSLTLPLEDAVRDGRHRHPGSGASRWRASWCAGGGT